MAITLRPPHQPVKKKAVIDGMIIRFVPDCADAFYPCRSRCGRNLFAPAVKCTHSKVFLRNASGSETGRQVPLILQGGPTGSGASGSTPLLQNREQ